MTPDAARVRRRRRRVPQHASRRSELPKDPTGKWACKTYTVGGQLVGLRKFEVVARLPGLPADGSGSGSGSGSDAKR